MGSHCQALGRSRLPGLSDPRFDRSAPLSGPEEILRIGTTSLTGEETKIPSPPNQYPARQAVRRAGWLRWELQTSPLEGSVSPEGSGRTRGVIAWSLTNHTLRLPAQPIRSRAFDRLSRNPPPSREEGIKGWLIYECELGLFHRNSSGAGPHELLQRHAERSRSTIHTHPVFRLSPD